MGMDGVQVFDGDGKAPNSIPSHFNGLAVYANRRGQITYHIFVRGADEAFHVTRRQFLDLTCIGDDVLTIWEFGALSMRKFLNDNAPKTFIDNNQYV